MDDEKAQSVSPRVPLTLTGENLTVDGIVAVARKNQAVSLDPKALARMAAARKVVDDYLAADRPVYGLNTGLGARVTHRLSQAELAAFSKRTVEGRANAVGPRLPQETVRAVMVVRLNVLLRGGAGASPAVAGAIADCLNAGLTPVMPSIGSIGAGDLCVLAHLGQALIGQGEMDCDGERLNATEALARKGLEPLVLGPKDGLALCNASSFSAGRAALVLADAHQIAELSSIAAALSLEGFRANLSPIDPRVAAARPAPGQAQAAARLRHLLTGGSLQEPGAARRLQDPISLRSASQVIGSLLAAIDFLAAPLEAEINGSGDNPLVLIDDEEILSTGNYHTPALALALDCLSQALAPAAGQSVSRSARLLTERLSGLPANLSQGGPGHSGFTPLLKVAEALLQQIRHLALPVPADLRWGADGVEDDLTNTPLAAEKAEGVLWRLRLVIAMELMVAAQAVDLAKPEKLGRGTEVAWKMVRAVVPPLTEDRPGGPDAERLDRELLANGKLLDAVQEALG